MKLLLTLLFLIAMGCATLPQNCLIMYYQVGCDGKYTHSYYYTGKIYEYPRATYPGMIISDQIEVNNYIGTDTAMCMLKSYPQPDVPWGCYNVMIGGYVLRGESAKDCVMVMPERIEKLP